jgi:glycosyltransferase involved in cell wall biosynthesis
MHICFVETGYPKPEGGGGGAGTYVQLVGRALVERGHIVSVVAGWYPDCHSVFDDAGVKVYRPPTKSVLPWYLGKIPLLKVGALPLDFLISSWHRYRFIETLNQKEPIDIAEFTEGGDFWHAFRPSFPYICHLHGSRYTFLKMSGRPVGQIDWFHRRLELSFIRQAEVVVSPCQAMLDIVEQEAGQPFKRKVVIPYPLDPRLLREEPAARENGHQKIVHFAARNDPVKGADVLLQAVPLVRQAVPEVEFRLFGFEPNGTFIPEGVQCFPFMPKDELLNHYHQADVCVIPSRWDNSPNTVYEAMAAGKAVVASKVGGIPELVVNVETGLLIEPDNPQTLAQAVVSILADEEKSSNFGRAGRKQIQRLANLAQNVERRLALYQEVIVDYSL